MKISQGFVWLSAMVVWSCSASDPDATPPTTTGTGITSSTSTSNSTTGTAQGGATTATSSSLTSTAASSTGLPTTTGTATQTGTATTGFSTATTSFGGTTTAGATGTTTTAGGSGGASATSTVSASSTTGALEGCESGPLEAPLPNCSPEPVPDTGDYYADCVARINQFRWECQCLPPLERWVEAEDCADQQAEYDYQQDSPHQGIRDNICQPGGGAQNECPDYGPNFGIVDFCLQQMWDEGPGEDFNAHGHYLNMSNENFSRVACGWYETPEGNVWAVQNFQ